MAPGTGTQFERVDTNLLHGTPKNKHSCQKSRQQFFPPCKCLLLIQGNFATSHVERDEAAGLTFNVVMDLTARGWGMYTLFCVPDNETEEPYVVAKVQDEPCYIHRCVVTGV